MRCRINPGSPPSARCLDCGHEVQEHIYPTGFCLGCMEIGLARLDMTEELHRRVDQLGFAVQVLSERLDAARIEMLEKRLDAFVSSWPRTERGVGDE